MVAAGLAFCFACALPAISDAAEALSILQAKCFGCHGDDPDDVRGGLNARSRQGLLEGGDSGEPALKPGDPEGSLLQRAIAGTHETLKMPPKASDRLTVDQIETIRRWIAAGAPWPEGSAVRPMGGVEASTSGGQTPEWTHRRYDPADLWAFQPPKRTIAPPPGPSHPIDAFLNQAMRAKGIAPARIADARTRVRRAAFDLWGLPPSAEETDAWVREVESGPDGFGRLADRLLSDPRYGEQAARHWFDIVRYADTAGFSNDFERPNVWRYRDYAIRSFNDDKPFDRFIIEQLAGDELDEDDPELLIATGFLRMGPWEHTGMSVAAVTRQQFLDDATNAVGVTFLGMPLRCASCHDHKFDPIPTKDYYRIQAVFAATQFADRDAPFSARENRDGFAEAQALTQRRYDAAKAEVERYQAKNREAIAAMLKERGASKADDLPASERPDGNFGLSAREMSLRKVHEKRRAYYDREGLRYQPLAFSVYNGPSVNSPPYAAKVPMPKPVKRAGETPIIRILKGGALESPGEIATPGVLSAVWAPPGSVATLTDAMSGRRLAFARWVAGDQNPLTARVLVNRIWRRHFGAGIVSSPNNFGKMGKRPSHPELLDWLAVWFTKNGWSMKKLHRLIMTSDAYQRSSRHPEFREMARIDPHNEHLWRYAPRRLAAEEVRDAMLAISGELNLAMGGPGVYPEIHWEAALQPRQIMGSVAPAYQPSPRPELRHRRTIYAFRFRTLADPALEVFDRPGGDASCPARDQTTTATQALTLLNGGMARDRALGLASRLAAIAPAPEQRIEQAFRRVYGRSPAAEEVSWCLDHLRTMEDRHRRQPPPKTFLPTRVRREMVEELTGEPFVWDEELDLMTSYQRDKQPWEVGPDVRALADLCLVLFNSNEFLYVR